MNYVVIGVLFYLLAACGPGARHYGHHEDPWSGAEYDDRCYAARDGYHVTDNPEYVYPTLAECEHYDDGD